jgi:hypothetical protein
MRTFLRVALSFLGGTVATYVAAVAVMLWYVSANRISDREGAMSMAIIFAIGPLAGLIGGTVIAFAVPAWLRRRDLRRPPLPKPPKRRWPPAWQAALAAIASGVVTYFIASGFITLLFGGMSFQTYAAALAVSLVPQLLALAAALLAALLVLRNARTA